MSENIFDELQDLKDEARRKRSAMEPRDFLCPSCGTRIHLSFDDGVFVKAEGAPFGDEWSSFYCNGEFSLSGRCPKCDVLCGAVIDRAGAFRLEERK